jgi:hypothetical protein
MTKSIRQILQSYKLTTEAELYSSDLHFKAFDTNYNMRGSIGPMKHEDLVENLHNQISVLRRRFD